MKTFAGNKPLDAIKAQCNLLGLEYDDYMWRNFGHDSVHISGGGGTVHYNTFNGKFFGTTDKGVEFDSCDDQFDDEPWMQMLLDFFYLPEV